MAVARSGSTTAASAEIALSQLATSSAVNELERLLSLRLFDRAGKRLLLNDNGRALLPQALALLDGAAGIALMSRDGSAQAQSLRIGASTTIGNYVLPRLLARFVAAQQGNASAWRSKVVIGNMAAICATVGAFELDVGLIEGPCHQAALAVTPWLQDEMAVVASPDSAWARMSLAGERVPVRTLNWSGGCVSQALERARPPTRACCPTCAPTVAASSWAVPRRSSTRPKRAWGWPASRRGASATLSRPAACAASPRPRRGNFGNVIGSCIATNSPPLRCRHLSTRYLALRTPRHED